MPDFYQMLFGSPSPGRTAPRRSLKYATNDPTPARARDQSEEESYLRYPEGRPDVIPGRPPPTREMRRPPSHVYSDPGSDTPVAPTPLSALTGVARAPLAPAAIEPYGDDFATWYDGSQRGNAGAVPDFASDTPPAAPAGRVPMYENNVPLGIEGGTRNIPTRVERGVNDHAPTEEQTFEPLPSTWDERRRAGIQPELNPTQEWIAAEERANERWRRGEPSVTDMFFAAVFGNRGVMGPDARIDRETQQMRDEVRNNGAERNTEGGGAW